MSLKNTTLKGMLWTFFQNFGRTGIKFLAQIFLARFIAPEQFGLLGMIGVFYGIAESLSNTGMIDSLIRMKNPSEEDYSTVNIVNILISIFIYFILFIGAPFIAAFYDQPILTNLIRVYSLCIVIGSLSSVQIARQTIALNFKIQTIIFLPSLIISSIVGIILGYLGFGVWALVYMQLLQVSLLALQYWLRNDWNPGFKLNIEKLKYHFSFGSNLLFTSILNNIFINIYPMFIGKFTTPQEVGFYSRGLSFRNLAQTTTNKTIVKVSFPALTQIKGDPIKFLNVFKRIYKSYLITLCILMGLMMINAKPMIIILITEKWLPSVTYLQLLCVGGVFIGASTLFMNALKVVGKSNFILKSAVIGKVIQLVILIISFRYGILYIIIGQIISEFFNLLISQFYSQRILNYSLNQQAKDLIVIIGPFLLFGSMCIFLQFFLETYINNFIIIMVNSMLFLLTFVISQYIFNREIITEILELRSKFKI